MEWVFHPLKKEVKSACAVMCLFMLIYYTVFSMFGGMYLVIAVLFSIAPLSRFFFPTRYVLTETGIETRHCGFSARRDWTRFCSYTVEKRGVFLKTLPTDSFVDNYRGLFLYFEPGIKDEVVSFIEEKFDRQKQKQKQKQKKRN